MGIIFSFLKFFLCLAGITSLPFVLSGVWIIQVHINSLGIHFLPSYSQIAMFFLSDIKAIYGFVWLFV